MPISMIVSCVLVAAFAIAVWPKTVDE